MTSGTPWAALDRELAAWAESGRIATLWWRDDDATTATSALDRLLDLAGTHDVPVALAVIPAGAQASLADRLAGTRASVLQHGFAHANHAGTGEKKAELGDHRPAGDVIAELREGWARLEALCRALAIALVPAMVPPWNRIGKGIVAALPTVGYAGLSTYEPRVQRFAAPGLLQVNTHVDVIDWRGSRGFVGEAQALAKLTSHLAARRRGAADADEPTGLMTHHLVHDTACWDFCAALAARIAAHPAARWLDAPSIFNMRGAPVPDGGEGPQRDSDVDRE